MLPWLQVSDIYRKMRGTLRFILGNLGGFDPKVWGWGSGW